MQIPNPYEFKIQDKASILKIVTLPVPDGSFIWPISTDLFDRSILAAKYSFTVPAGITSIKISMGTSNGKYLATAQIQNIDSKKYWFDNINNDSILLPVIKVTPKKLYNLTIGSTVPIKDGGNLRLLYSNEINKSTIDTSDE